MASALAAISAASASPTPPAAARLSVASAAPFMMSGMVRPPLTSSSMPAAASLAENDVSLPSFSARPDRSAISFWVAPLPP